MIADRLRVTNTGKIVHEAHCDGTVNSGNEFEVSVYLAYGRDTLTLDNGSWVFVSYDGILL